MNTQKKTGLFTRNFTLLLLGQLFSLLGNGALRFALSMYVLEKSGSAAVFGTLLALGMAPAVLLTPFGGVLADRVNRRNVMVGLDLSSGISVLAAALFFSDSRGIGVTAALLMVLSVLGAFESPTVQACVPQMLSGENVLRGNAAVNQASAVSGLVTPFLGSLLYVAYGVRPVLAGAGVCFLLTALLEGFIVLPAVPAGGKGLREILREDLVDSARFLMRERREVLDLLLFAALISFFLTGLVIVGLPFLVRRELGLPAQFYGAVESAVGMSAILGSAAAGVLVTRLPFRRLYLLVVGLGIFFLLGGGAMALPLGVLARYGVLAAVFCGGQAGACIFSVFGLTAIQQRTPEQMTGKIMSYTIAISMCAQPAGQLVYGVWFDCMEGGAVLLLNGVAVLTAGILSRKLFKSW